MKNKITKLINNSQLLFAITSILFGLCFLFQVPHGDDIAYYYVESGKIIDCFNKCLQLTRGSIYTLFTNTFIMYVINKPLIVFIVVISITMFIMLNTMRELFSKGNKNENIINLFIICMVCSYSYIDMSSAGWLDTTLSYFMPTTFCFVSLIPIKKILKNETITKLEFIIYLVSILIAIDNVQAMAMLIACYFIFLIYAFATKKKNLFLIIAFIMICASAVLALTSPRFAYRTTTEIIKRYPTIGMTNFVSKIDLGIFPTIRWIFFGDNPFVLICLIIFAILIFISYKNTIYRIISIVPIILSLLFKNYINSNLSINAYDLKPIEFGTSNYGLFNLESVYSNSLLLQYSILCLLITLIIIEIVLLSKDNLQLLIIFTLLASGFGTRFAMAFTPTVFASHLRTYIYFAFSIIAITIYIFANNIDKINSKYYFLLSLFFVILSSMSLMYFFIYVYNYMGESIFNLIK